MLKRLARSITRTVEQKSPELLFVGGCIAIVGGLIAAFDAGRKVDKILDEYEEEKAKIENMREVLPERYSEEDAKGDMRNLKVQTGLKITKKVAPSVVAAAGGIICMGKGQRILKKRVFKIMSDYVALNQLHSAYEDRVKEQFGDEADFNVKNGLVKTKTVDGNDVVCLKHAPLPARWSFIFDESSRYWSKDAGENQKFLRRIQAKATEHLRSHRFLYLIDVLDWLGIDVDGTVEEDAKIVGWHMDYGDQFVDFNLYDVTNQRKSEFLKGTEPNVLLEFNCFGPLWAIQ